MKFYIIYSIDCPKDDKITRFYPQNIKPFTITEIEADNPEEQKHRKMTGLLTKKQFKSFIDSTGLTAQSVETMGSLTMEFGLIPAISFWDEIDAYSYNVRKDAYITPILEWKETVTERDWERMRKAILNMYA